MTRTSTRSDPVPELGHETRPTPARSEPLDARADDRPRSAASAILRGSGAGVLRLVFTSFVSLGLPAFLTHNLTTGQYSAWVTILQVSAYVGLLDLGLQTVVARFIAEHHARREGAEAVRVVHTAVLILSAGSLLGMAAVLVAAWNVSALFPDMPSEVRGPAQIGLVLVGFSCAGILPFGPFLAAFTGLQRYGFSVLLTVVSRVASAIGIIAAAALGTGIIGMACALAATNLLTAVMQFVGWRRSVRPLLEAPSGSRPDRASVTRLLSTGGLIALWSMGSVLVSGLDTVIVGHFDFRAAGAFAIAATAVNFLLLLLNSLFSPVMPAAAAIHGPDALERVRDLTLRSTRYSTLVIVVLSAGLCVLAYPLLLVWVGPEYARTGAPLLQLLVLGHAVRQLGGPYSLVVIARGQQGPATVATMAEAVVNVCVSVALAAHIGAAGVAIGTVTGAAVSLLLHLIVSMHFTKAAIPLSRREIGFRGVVLPVLTAAPMLLVLPSYRSQSFVPAEPVMLLAAVVLTAAAVLFLGIDRQERARLVSLPREFIRRRRLSSAA